MERIKIRSSISSESYKIVDDGKIFFLKQIHSSYLKVIKKIEKKVIQEKLISLNSTYLTKVISITYENEVINILTEFVRGIPLNDFIQLKKYGRHISLELANHFAATILFGINALHSNNIIHGDLKPSNIIIEEPSLTPKITDFFFNYVKFPEKVHIFKRIFTKSYRYSLFSSQYYMPPRAFLNINPKKGLDYFAAGIILFIIYTGKPPVPKEFLFNREKIIKWKLSKNHLNYYIKNLEKGNISLEITNTILELLSNYFKYHNLKKIAQRFS